MKCMNGRANFEGKDEFSGYTVASKDQHPDRRVW